MKYELGLLISGILGLVGLFGWSHKTMRERINSLQAQANQRISEPEVRLLIDDKLAPHRVEYIALSQRLGELRDFYRDLDHKLDLVLEICSKIKHDR